MSVIVVGVDHSAGAQDARRFALEEAQLFQATLRAVHAWQFGYIGVAGIEGGLPAVGAKLTSFAAPAAALDATLREAIPDAGDVEVDRRVVEGGLRSCFWARVSHHCAQHAERAAVIVRSKADTD